MYALNNGSLPMAFNNIFITNDTRNIHNPDITMRRTNKASNTIRHKGPAVWYTIPENIKIKYTIKSFMRNLRRVMLMRYAEL